jgi:hypothetical protein
MYFLNFWNQPFNNRFRSLSPKDYQFYLDNYFWNMHVSRDTIAIYQKIAWYPVLMLVLTNGLSIFTRKLRNASTPTSGTGTWTIVSTSRESNPIILSPNSPTTQIVGTVWDNIFSALDSYNGRKF